MLTRQKIVDLSDINLTSRWQLEITRVKKRYQATSWYNFFPTSGHTDLTSEHKYLTSQHKNPISRHNYLTN